MSKKVFFKDKGAYKIKGRERVPVNTIQDALAEGGAGCNGIMFEDRSTGTFYVLYVEDGDLMIAPCDDFASGVVVGTQT